MKKQKPRKIQNLMLLIPSLGVGGSERSLCNISNLLADTCRVFVAVFHANGIAYSHGGTLVNLNCPSSASKLKKPFVMLRRIIALRKAIRRHHIDALIGFTGVGSFYVSYASKRCVRVISNRGFEDIVNGEKLYARLLERSDHLLFNSHGSRDWFTRRHPPLAERTTTIENCFDLSLIAKKAEQPVDEQFAAFCASRDVIVSVGRMYEVKGFDFLIKAFWLLHQKMPNAGLVIVGDGPAMPQLRALVEAGGLQESVLLPGMRRNPFPYMANSKLYALPSRAEGFPNALVEAMACGTPVVCANCVSGPNEILHDDYVPDLHVEGVYKAPYGLLVPPVETPADDCIQRISPQHHFLAEAMELLLKDSSLRDMYHSAARRRAIRFSFAESRAKYESFLNALCDGGNTDDH